ncbi:MAG: hypothetical protein ACOYXC_09340 [Candidatus Rifleibacteriota bacterium]
MVDTERFVLPFKWREFGKWFSTLGPINNNQEKLEIKDIHFEAGEKRLEGIRIMASLQIQTEMPADIFLLTFLADMETLELFEPFFGSPDRLADVGLSGRFVRLEPGKTLDVELFIPDQGWILPSIWRFLVQSIGLKKKESSRMPEIIVFGFEVGKTSRPFLFASQEFDYFGHANRLKEEIALKDFFKLLNLSPDASESDVQRAYISCCRDHQNDVQAGHATELAGKRNSSFARIKNGYQIWTDKLNNRY